MRITLSILLIIVLSITSFAKNPVSAESKKKTALRITSFSIGIIGTVGFLAFNNSFQKADDRWDQMNQPSAANAKGHTQDDYYNTRDERKRSNAGRILSAIAGGAGLTLFTISWTF